MPVLTRRFLLYLFQKASRTLCAWNSLWSAVPQPDQVKMVLYSLLYWLVIDLWWVRRRLSWLPSLIVYPAFLDLLERLQIPSPLISYLKNCSHSPAVVFYYYSKRVTQVFVQSPTSAVAEKWILKGYWTSVTAALHSHSRCQVTSVLIAQSVLVLPQSHSQNSLSKSADCWSSF